MTLYPSENDAKSLAFTVGNDGIKWGNLWGNAFTEAYLIDNNGVHLSLAGSAPVGKPIPLGVSTPQAGKLHFALPHPEAMPATSLWLIDYATGYITDLMSESYTAQMDSAGVNNTRFALQIGGVRPNGNGSNTDTGTKASWKVKCLNHCIEISQLEAGDKLQVHSTAGQLVLRATAAATSYTTDPMPEGVYIVTVNAQSKKIAVK